MKKKPNLYPTCLNFTEFIKSILIAFFLVLMAVNAISQQCSTSPGCSNFVKQYPSGILTTTSSSWQVVRTDMNAGNYTLFSVIKGNTYEWSYCQSHTQVALTWDAQLTLYNEANTSAQLCFSTDACGLAPYISWTADFHGTVRLLTTAYISGGCKSNSGSPFNKLVWRQSATASASVGDLLITVKNIGGSSSPIPGANGVVRLFNSSNVQVGSDKATSSGGGVTFSSITAGTGYSYKVYHDLGTIYGSEYWGTQTGVTVNANQSTPNTFTRNQPYVESVKVYNGTTDVTGQTVAPNTQLRVEQIIRNPSGSSQNVQGQVIADISQSSSYDHLMDWTSSSSVSAGGTRTNSWNITTTTTAGTYYYTTGVKTTNVVTDGWNWTSSLFKVAAASVGDLLITVKNIGGSIIPSGTITVRLYNSSNVQIRVVQTTSSNGSLIFSSITAGTGYSYKVYHDLGTIYGSEYWGTQTGVTINANQSTPNTFTRNQPYVESVKVYNGTTDVTGQTVAPNTQLRVEQIIRNPSGSSQNVQGQVIADISQSSSYDHLMDWTSSSSVSAGGTRTNSWNITTTTTPGTYYYTTGVKITNVVTDGWNWTETPLFKLASTTELPKITLTSPNGGENWEIGLTKTIKWESKNLNDNVSIEVNGNYPDGNWETIAKNIPDNQSYTYNIEGTPGKQKRIRVKSYINPTINGISSNNFSFIPKTINQFTLLGALANLANKRDGLSYLSDGQLAKNYNNGEKVYAYISKSSPDGPKIGIQFFIDLADYYSCAMARKGEFDKCITTEGRDGWVTIWVNGKVGVEFGFESVLPFGVGITSPEKFTPPQYDPKRSFNFSAIELKLPFWQVSLFNSNDNGSNWGEISHPTPLDDFGFSIIELGLNVYRFEIKADELDRLINNAFAFSLVGNSINTIGIQNSAEILIGSIIAFEGDKIILNPSLTGNIRKFSSTDNNETGVDGVINFLSPSNRKITDNTYPIVPETFSKLPLPNNRAELTFQNTGEPADFIIKVKGVPEGWFVGASDDREGLINDTYTFWSNDDSYEFSDVPGSEDDPKRFETTFWNIACLNNAPLDEANLTFELYNKRSFLEGKEFLDKKTIKVSKQKDVNNRRPYLGTVFPNSNVSLDFDDELQIKWTDVDIDDNATIAIALDPNVFIDTPLGSDLNLTPWVGQENHTWIASNLKEDDDGSEGKFIFKTKGWKAGQYSLWAVIWDGKNEPFYIRFNGIISISLGIDDIIPYSIINSIKGKWFKESPKLDINTYDNIGLNTTSYQVASASNLKSAGNADSKNMLLEDLDENWNPLTINGSLILGESLNNLEDSLTTDWKINNSDWNKLISNNQDLEKHYIVLKVTDDAGNTYITPDSNSAYELKIDIHNPNIVIQNPIDGQNLQSNTVEVKWSADDLFNGMVLSGIDAIFISIDQSEDFIQIESNVTNYKFSNLNNGVHTIYIKIKDAAGNFSELKHVNFSINSTIQLPDIVTTNVSSIFSTSAICGGIIIDSKGIDIIEKGLCWSSTINPTISLPTKTNEGTGSGIFTSQLSGLSAGTIYHVRAYATNSAGTSYGEDVTFTTPSNGVPKTVKDIDGNEYTTVTIGTQVWLGQNLKTTKYNDGTAIPLVTENNAWSTLSMPAYSWYNNDISNKNPYGALYNWYSVSTGKLCPVGWHVPTNTEWTELTNYLGGENTAGGKLKEPGLIRWLYPNIGATNESNFTGLPSGNRNYISANFYGLGNSSLWWSNTENGNDNAWFRVIYSDSEYVKRLDLSKSYGFSVRCLYDVLTSSTNELSNTIKVVMYPNPTKDIVNISLDQPVEGDFKIDIYNNIGLLLQSKNSSFINSIAQIDLAVYTPGIYLIKISTKNISFVGKILKQ